MEAIPNLSFSGFIVLFKGRRKMTLLRFFFLFSALLFVSAQNGTHRSFPAGFLFGAATSSYQAEGAWNASDKGENIWDRLCYTSNLVKDGSSGDVACDSYNQIDRDVEMLKELGVHFYRFSLSWSRILPTGFDNKVSADGIRYYNNLIDALIANGITPAITLYHWDLPQPLQDIGGWPNPLMEKYFTDFARVAFNVFGDRVKEWLTFNEPYEVCQAGYGNNGKAPALNFLGIADYLCAHTLIKSHARVYHLYVDEFKPTQNGRVGLTISAGWKEPENPNSAADLEASENALQFSAGWYAHPIYSEEGDYPAVFKQKIAQRSAEQGFSSSRLPAFTPEEMEYIKGAYDYLGLNHYTSSVAKAADGGAQYPSPSFWEDLGITEYQPGDWPSSPASDWLKVVPWGFTKLLVWLKNEYKNPEIIIFENGYSDLGGTDDADRISYYKHYLNAMLDAMDQGVTVTAYTAWSLIDNFEWLSGYTEKFGLFAVDFNNPSRPRTAKDSAKYYNTIIGSNAIDRV